jgi:hypothetical protein
MLCRSLLGALALVGAASAQGNYVEITYVDQGCAVTFLLQCVMITLPVWPQDHL